jgi:hypothetical protein
MHKDLKFPESFPNNDEELFLKLILCNEPDFPGLWEQWLKENRFDDIDFATMGLVPLLYLQLRKFAIKNEITPAIGPLFSEIPKITGRIKGIYKLAWFKNQMLMDTVSKIVLLFNQKNIPVMLLKGIPLLLNVYKDTGARFLGDADILIEPQFAPQVVNLMLSNGWSYKDINPSLSANRELAVNSLNRITHATTFINEQKIEIDIHWNVFHIDNQWNALELLFLKKTGPKVFNDLHWKNSQEILIKGVHCRTLCIEDILIHIIAHGAGGNKHRPFRWVADAVHIIRNSEINWEFLLENTKKFDLNVELYFGISYLIKHNFIDVSDSVVREISKLPLKEKKIKQYYKSSKVERYSLLGNNLPFLWYRYWNFEQKKAFPLNYFYFIDYLSKSWGLDKKRQIPLFILGKYKKIISYYLNRSKNLLLNKE